MTKQTKEHSPFEWIARERGGDKRGIIRDVRTNTLIAVTESMDDAQFIVTACNSFYEREAVIEDLVSALESAEVAIEAANSMAHAEWQDSWSKEKKADTTLRNWREKRDEALAKAKASQ